MYILYLYYLFQLFNTEYFVVFKYIYSCFVNDLAQIDYNYIDKLDFLVADLAAELVIGSLRLIDLYIQSV